MAVKKTVGTALLSVLLPLFFASAAKAGEEKETEAWQSATATYNLDSGTAVVRLQEGSDSDGWSTYGFADLFSSDGDFDGAYGEFRVRRNITNGFSAGAEYNDGTDYEGVIRPHLAYSCSFKHAFLDIKFSPIESSGKLGQQLGLYGAAELGHGFRLEGWLDMDFSDGITGLGEVELSKELGENAYAVARAEKYPGTEPELSLGMKFSF